MWLYKIKRDFGQAMETNTVTMTSNVVIGEDTQACFADAQKDRLSECTNDVDITYLFGVDHVRKGDATVEYVPSKQLVGNIMTKNFATQKLLAL